MIIASSAAPRQAAADDDDALPRMVQADFPILRRRIGGQPLVYLDTAATAQKPQRVLEAMRSLYETSYANVHRGVHTLGHEATAAYEAARERVARFINAARAEEIVFVRNATEAINLIAATLGRAQLAAGDEIVISELEHHANIVPWQMLRDATGVVLRVVPIDADGDLRLDAFEAMLTERTRLVSITHISNVLGTITPVEAVVRLARRAGALVLLDGCQAVAHGRVDVQALDCDFYVFSGHKAYGPTGIGVLYGQYERLRDLPPYQVGGEMIGSVSFERTTFKQPPHRFEAGTPAFVEAVGLASALDYVNDLGFQRITAHEQRLLAYAQRALSQLAGLCIVGMPRRQGGILSFVMEGVHPHDIATVLDARGIAIRAGHHCAQPLMQRLGLPATARVSFGVHNTTADVDALVEGLRDVREIFK